MVDHRGERHSAGVGGVRAVVFAVAIVLVAIAGIWLVNRVRPSREPVNGTAALFSEFIETGEARGFNVLRVTLDTVRADRLGCYGH